MFSYRHAFHAGNHADVLKHTTLIATLRHLMEKETPITLVDTHAGAGLYRLDGDYTETGGEAKDGIVKLMAALRPAQGAGVPACPALDDYLDLIAGFNPSGSLRVYPGSPFVLQTLLRDSARDRLKLFELHPTDGKTLDANIAQLGAGRQIAVSRQDGFEGLKPLLPPPPSATGSKRALVLIDPSYEIKNDYGKSERLHTRSAPALPHRYLPGLVPDHSAARGTRSAAPPEDAEHPGQAPLAPRHAGDWPGSDPWAGGPPRPHRQRHVCDQPAPHAQAGAASRHWPSCWRCWAAGAARRKVVESGG